MEVEEAGGLVENGFLEFLLSWGVGWKVANAACGGVILGEGIH